MENWIVQMSNYLEGEWGIKQSAAGLLSLLYLYLSVYGLAPRITSGYRSQAYQDALRARWDKGDRAGLVVRPANVSTHTSGRAIDITTTNPELAAQIARALNIQAGYYFATSDPVHYQTT